MIEALASLVAALIPLVREALGAGASHDDVARAVKEAMIAASDAEMHRELDP